MSSILHIATAVPPFKVKGAELVEFYTKAVAAQEPARFAQKLAYLDRKTRIETRYSCIPDYNGKEQELFTGNAYEQPVEKRMALYRRHVLPLAATAIDKLFAESAVKPPDITHLITVSCTGLFAPGLEFLIAERYGMQQAEKTAVNFLGCYAAIKALKQADYIAQAQPEACILIVSAELCSLHFHPSEKDEDLVANLLFADGAAAVLVCGAKNKLAQNKPVLKLDAIGSAYVPGTAGLMAWELSSGAFRMLLSPEVVQALRENMPQVIKNFAGGAAQPTDHWAIHPGGVKIIGAVQQSLGLGSEQVNDSLEVLRQYGNMSSPTVLFVLGRLFNRLKESGESGQKNINACAFGPGLSIELLRLSFQPVIGSAPLSTAVPEHAVSI